MQGTMPPAKKFFVYVNLGLTEAMAERLERVSDKDKGETRLAAIREALDALIKKREAARHKGRGKP
jgi:metal-responsive CopG/Arc/MetJ family transcriptional regulator